MGLDLGTGLGFGFGLGSGFQLLRHLGLVLATVTLDAALPTLDDGQRQVAQGHEAQAALVRVRVRIRVWVRVWVWVGVRVGVRVRVRVGAPDAAEAQVRGGARRRSVSTPSLSSGEG